VGQARDALLFFQRWAHAQKQSMGVDASCLMECGPCSPHQTRKWIIDLDGKLAQLREWGFIGQDAPCLEEVSLLNF
jgi:hypothetical protein